jgi:hypothetical protein
LRFFCPLSPSTPEGITAHLATVTLRVGKKKKTQRVVQVFSADTGALKSQFTAPFRTPVFKNIEVSVRDTNGDGVPDQVVVTATKGKRNVTQVYVG